MKCLRCESENILHIIVKCNDMIIVTKPNDKRFFYRYKYEGCPNKDININNIGINIRNGDYIEFYVCLDCSTIQLNKENK